MKENGVPLFYIFLLEMIADHLNLNDFVIVCSFQLDPDSRAKRADIKDFGRNGRGSGALGQNFNLMRPRKKDGRFLFLRAIWKMNRCLADVRMAIMDTPMEKVHIP